MVWLLLFVFHIEPPRHPKPSHGVARSGPHHDAETFFLIFRMLGTICSLFFIVTPIALVLLISLIIPLVNDERKCIHDYILKTKFNLLS